MEYVIGVDIGGTCTDCVVMDEQGQITIAKAFSTPQDFSAGILDALEVAARQLGVDTRMLLSRAKLFLHGTTIAENAIFEFRYDIAGWPKRIESRDDLIDLYDRVVLGTVVVLLEPKAT